MGNLQKPCEKCKGTMWSTPYNDGYSTWHVYKCHCGRWENGPGCKEKEWRSSNWGKLGKLRGALGKSNDELTKLIQESE